MNAMKTGYDSDCFVNQLVVFGLDNQEFGIEISKIREIVRPQKTTAIPLTPEYFIGLMNLRGSILPVIDTRIRIGLESHQEDDATRCLVITQKDYTAALLVDEVKEVLSFCQENAESPPPLTDSLEHFVDRVLKLQNGDRLIFILDTERLLEYGVELGFPSGSASVHSFYQSGDSDMEDHGARPVDFRRYITFRLADETYAFEICKVREIIRHLDLRNVPDAPPYIKGILSLRQQVIPVFDLRLLMGVESLYAARERELSELQQFFKARMKEADSCLCSGRHFNRCPSGLCPLDNWLMQRLETCRSERELNIIQNILKEHHQLHDCITDDNCSGSEKKMEMLKEVTKRIEDMFSIYEEELSVCIKEEQRILILNFEGRAYGLLVDKVDEVIEVSRDEMEVPSGFSEDIDSIAKLDGGTKIIFILNDKKIVPVKDIEEYSSDEGKEMVQQSQERSELDEIQLVTFNIGDEEYGVPIVMVQEINRLGSITKVPKAPKFVDGVTNLRGSVIPVIDLRKRFGISSKENDDRTRLIIINLAETKTGFIVDRVNEVKRLQKTSIEPPPTLLSAQIDLRFVSGIAKADKERMIIVLDVEKVLSSQEIQALENMTDSDIGKSEGALNIKGVEEVEEPALEIME